MRNNIDHWRYDYRHKLKTIIMTQNTKGCCPKFNPQKWDEKTHQWNKKPFIKESIPAFFHIPFLPMIGKKITKMMELVESSKKMLSNPEDILLLFNDPHPFKSDIYLLVTDPVKNANNVQLSGTFISKVFEGPYNAIPKIIKEMNEYLAQNKQRAKDYYVHYAYCPKCAKKTGHNYMIIFAKV